MTTLARRNSSIHKIREYTLPKVNLDEEYEIIHEMQEGWRGRLLLVEHKRTRHEVVLKAIHKECASKLEFFREFHYNYYLSPHINILNAYDVAFQAGDYYVFAQEYAPFGDLTSNLSETGLGEANVKKIAPQITSALEFMHSKDLVHRNVNMDNILVFNIDFSEVKLCDFGETRKSGALIKRKTVSLPYAAPEIVDTVQNESFNVSTKQDVWQMGVLLYILLTGTLPWQKADVTDPRYLEYIHWKKRKTLKTPKRFSNFTARALRMFKRMLEPKPDKRANIREVYKYLEDKWLVRPMKRQDSEADNQSVCYSTFSVHSSKVEKDKVLHALKAHGIETTVDRIAKRKRIHEWIEKSLASNYMFDEVENEHIENKNDIYQQEPRDSFAVKENAMMAAQNNIINSMRNLEIPPFKEEKPTEGNDRSKIHSGVKIQETTLLVNEQNVDRSQLISSKNSEFSALYRRKSEDKQGTNSVYFNSKPQSLNQRESPLKASSNVHRASSFQEKSQQNLLKPDNYVSNNYKDSPSLKSHYSNRSPNRSNSNPLRSQSNSQNIYPKYNSGSTNSHISPSQNKILSIKQNQERSRQPTRNPYSAIKSKESEATQRSKSLAKTRERGVDRDVRKSRTQSYVNSSKTTTVGDSDESTTQSDDSMTSVIPVAYYH